MNRQEPNEHLTRHRQPNPRQWTQKLPQALPRRSQSQPACQGHQVQANRAPSQSPRRQQILPAARDGKSWFNHDLINPFVID